MVKVFLLKIPKNLIDHKLFKYLLHILLIKIRENFGLHEYP